MKKQIIEDIKNHLGIESLGRKDSFICIEELEYNNLEKYFNKKDELTNPNNIYIDYAINKKKIEKGIDKTIKLKRTVENNKTEKTKINLKLPINIQNGQRIIFYGEGHRKNGINGNLIVKIKIH